MTASPGNREFDDTRPQNSLAAGTEISHYRIVEKIGAGGMGVVYRALDTRLDRAVALKFLPSSLLCDTDARSRFEHEARAASAINHPNITTIYEIDEAGGQCFIAMEFVEGATLKDLSRKRTLSLKETIDIAIQTCQGLKAAHEKAIVHRDIKSANIMVSGSGAVKIMDFGLAKLRGVTKLTRTGTTLGTIHYMSPEQAQGEEVDRRSDIFSFGVVLYEMVTGRLPFTGDYEQAVLYSIVNDAPEPMARYKRGVPSGLQHIVDKALAKNKGERYQHADEILADLKIEKRLLERAGEALDGSRASAGKIWKRRLRILIPAALVVAVAVVLLVFEPFRIEMGPRDTATAREHSLAIMYFENLAEPDDPDKLGEIVTNLLITDLSESQYLTVVSGQRLHDILKLLGMEGAKIVDKDVASEVAAKANARWMLLGSILRIEPRIVLTTQMVDTGTGDVRASQRVDGAEGEDIFGVVDRLVVEIRNDLSLPTAAGEGLNRSVADVTTHSEEAYRYYLEGVDHSLKYEWKEAVHAFEKAIELDSTFAMAYYGLFQASSDESVEENAIAEAIRYSDQVTERERYYILARAARHSGDQGEAEKNLQQLLERYPDEKEALEALASICDWRMQFGKAIEYLKRVIEIDPLYKEAYNGLAYDYGRIGNFEKALWAADMYVSVAPDEHNPYDTRGDILAKNGRLDQAIESYERSLSIRPDFGPSVSNLGNLYLFKREYAKAESLYRELCSSEDADFRSEGRIRLAYLEMYQGKFEQALQTLDAGIAADRLDRAEYWLPDKYDAKSEIYRERNEIERSHEEELRTLDEVQRLWPDEAMYWHPGYVRVLAEKGEIDEAKTEAEVIRERLKGGPPWQESYYRSALAIIDIARGDLEAAAVNLAITDSLYSTFWTEVELARVYLRIGKLAEAVTLSETMLTRYGAQRACVPIQAVKAHYYLGQAYEESGWTKKAMGQYREFLEIWKSADPGIAEVEDARARLARLKGSQ